jgi:hypothetical protein
MKSIKKMSNLELRVALIRSGPAPWVNLQINQDGELVGQPSGILSEGSSVVPNSPEDNCSAECTIEYVKQLGIEDQYLHQLAKTFPKSGSPSPRGISEAALIALRPEAYCP